MSLENCSMAFYGGGGCLRRGCGDTGNGGQRKGGEEVLFSSRRKCP